MKLIYGCQYNKVLTIDATVYSLKMIRWLEASSEACDIFLMFFLFQMMLTLRLLVSLARGMDVITEVETGTEESSMIWPEATVIEQRSVTATCIHNSRNCNPYR